jgi:hypothetical protein
MATGKKAGKRTLRVFALLQDTFDFGFVDERIEEGIDQLLVIGAEFRDFTEPVDHIGIEFKI